MITFYLARLLGKDAMHLIFGEERIGKFIHHLNSKRAFAIILVLFLIPGFPKDLITYAAGVSEVKMKPFLLLSLVGRTPAMMGTVMMGSICLLYTSGARGAGTNGHQKPEGGLQQGLRLLYRGDQVQFRHGSR